MALEAALDAVLQSKEDDDEDDETEFGCVIQSLEDTSISATPVNPTPSSSAVKVKSTLKATEGSDEEEDNEVKQYFCFFPYSIEIPLCPDFRMRKTRKAVNKRSLAAKRTTKRKRKEKRVKMTTWTPMARKSQMTKTRTAMTPSP
jgi:hypothetical protein